MASHGSGRPDGPNQEQERRKNDVLNEMLDLFLESLEFEVIQSVLESCDFDYDKSREALYLVSETTQNETPVLPPPQPPAQPRHPEHQRIQHVNPKPSIPMTQSAASTQGRAQQSPSHIVQSPRKVNPADQTLERIHQYIKDGNKILVLMRGCPGSGKSYLAAQLVELCGGEQSNHHFSSDDYFQKNGRYAFNPQELQSAHKSTQDNVLRAIRNSFSPVIVDNTNTQSWEMQVYVIMAVNHGYAVETLEPQTPWKFNHSQLVKKNRHNVPAEKILAMLDRYEHGLSGEDIIKQLKLNYPPSKYPPQPARKLSNRRTEQAVSPAKQLTSPALFSSPLNMPTLGNMPLGKLESLQINPDNNIRDQIRSAAVPLEPEPIQPVSKIPETVLAKPSTSGAQLPLLWTEGSSFSRENPIALPWKNPSSEISGSPEFDVFQSTFQSYPQSSHQPNPKTSDHSECSNTAVSQQSNENNVLVTGVLINLESPVPGGETQSSVDTPNPAQKLTDSKESTQNLEWGNADWDAFVNEASKSKSDNDFSTDQRRRWFSSNSGDTSRDEKQDKCASGTLAQNVPIISNDWGCHEVAWSWDVSSEETKDLEIDFSQRKIFVPSSKQDSSTNTNYQDFFLVSSNTCPSPLPSGVRLLTATSRDINANLVNYVPPIPKKIVVDVSSMTDDECGGPVEGSLDKLLLLFPHVSKANLEDLLDTCHGDVNWASNCLLDNSGVRLDIVSLSSSETPLPEGPSPVDDTRQPVEFNSNYVIRTESKSDMTESAPLNRSLSQNSIHLRSDRNVALRRSSSLPMVTLQNSDSQIFTLPETITPQTVTLPNSDLQTCTPPETVTPQTITPPKVNTKNFQTKVPKASPPETPKQKRSLYPDLPNDSEIEVPEGSDESETSSQEEDEMLEFVISPEFSQQLFSRFGGPQNKFRKSGLSPVLRIPESIAHQIHCYLVLSQEEYYAEDNGGEEEEEFCSETQGTEIIDQRLYEEMCSQKPLTEQEQEDMELARAIYELDLAAVYNSKDTMAAVLARRLLQETFPTLDPNLLEELLEVHGNSFHKTKEMIQKHYMNSYTVKQKDFPALSKSQPKTPTRERLNVSERVRLKPDADGELRIARIYKQKAKEQSARREWSAAAVLSQMAKVHKRQHNRNMELTVQRVFADNMKSYCPSSLDLHFLVVDEALIRLDDFLDGHILSLVDQPNNVKSLYIITGRGKHSSGGIPKIRPAVLQRLDERRIESSLENPGLVKVEVTGRSPLSYEC